MPGHAANSAALPRKALREKFAPVAAPLHPPGEQ